MADDPGPRLDSDLVRIDFLFRTLETGRGFVEHARRHSDRELRADTLGFAQAAHDAVVRLSASERKLTPGDRERLEGELDALRAAIDTCTSHRI